MRFVIVTGISGAGKSTALKMLEDMNYFCVDNLPVPLIEKFSAMAIDMTRDDMKDVALGVDVRSGQSFNELEKVLDKLKASGYQYEILFLDASDSVLIKRYKETRRNHPLSAGGRVDIGIRKERYLLAFLKARANYIIDTSKLLTKDLRKELEKIFVEDQEFQNLMISVLSFGFKYGIPRDSDLVFDVRFLPNPYYVDELRALSGEDAPVRDFVMASQTAQEFALKLEDMVKFLIPHYVNEGKNNLVISIGCTGGKHRSVTIANELYRRLIGGAGYGLRIEHRDISKDAIRKKI